MKHMKRQNIPKNWPIPRKGTKYFVRATSKGVPLLVILRDMLKLAQNRKEVKKAIHLKSILISGKVAQDEKKNLELFDTITIIPSKENYRLELSDKGKYVLGKIKAEKSKTKVSKIIGKKTLKGKKVQLNLSDGRNFLSDAPCKVNDSVIVDLDKNKISKCLELKEKAEVFVVEGKHVGEKGTIKKFIPARKMAEVEIDKKLTNVLIKQLMVVE